MMSTGMIDYIFTLAKYCKLCFTSQVIYMSKLKVLRRKFNFRMKRSLHDSSVSSLNPSWLDAEEGHPATKNLLQLSQG